MRYRNRQLNNKGFSLVELIVTILIIAIISTSSVVAISVVYNSDVDRAAKIMTTSMNQGRQQALSIADSEHSAARTKTDVYTVIYLNDDGYYCADVYSQETTTITDESGNITVASGTPNILDSKQLGKYKMTVEFGVYDSSSHTVTTVTPNFENNDEVVFTYDRSSGGIQKSYVKSGTDGTITEYEFTDAFINGSKTVNLVFVRETGRCYIYD